MTKKSKNERKRSVCSYKMKVWFALFLCKKTYSNAVVHISLASFYEFIFNYRLNFL